MYYNNDTIIFLDGKYVKAAEANADMYSQSLHYGYAVFEGIRTYIQHDGTIKVFKGEEHYKRLQQSCEAVYIPFNYSVEELIDITLKVIELNKLTDAYVRPLVFCPPNMSLQKANTSSLMIAVWSWGAYLGEKLLRVKTSSFARPNPSGFKIHAKVSGHYVNSILACQEAKSAGFDEALLLDGSGFIAEGPGANVFIQKDGKLYTPTTANILPGITRATIIELCKQHGIVCEEKNITPQEIKQADSAFLCGTAAEVIGMESIDDYTFPINWNESIGKKIQTLYKNCTIGV
ncbi:MAG: branched-chain amino acid transaminase [Chitinophagaceae bacterium]